MIPTKMLLPPGGCRDHAERMPRSRRDDAKDGRRNDAEMTRRRFFFLSAHASWSRSTLVTLLPWRLASWASCEERYST